MTGQPVPFGNAPDKVGVEVGFLLAQPVVQVAHGQLCVSGLMQQVQQHHRVHPAGHTDQVGLLARQPGGRSQFSLQGAG